MADKILKTRILQKVDTAARWKSNNPILAKGEIGYESDTGRMKVGADGNIRWTQLHYIDEYSTNKISSRGEQLVTNGNGLLENNTNFSGFTFDPSEANGSPGSFTHITDNYITRKSDELFAIVPSETYEVSVDMKANEKPFKTMLFLNFYDVDKKDITSSYHMYISGSLTRLARDLKPGDTTVYFEDLSGWNEKTDIKYVKSFIIWNYTNSKGYTYPAETYSRNYYTDLYDKGNVNKNNNTITLRTGWKGPLIKAGTELSQGSAGGTYKYCITTNLTQNWETYKGYYCGTDYSGTNDPSKFPPGAAFVNVGWLWNFGKTVGSQAWFTNLSVKQSVLVKYEDITKKLSISL